MTGILRDFCNNSVIASGIHSATIAKQPISSNAFPCSIISNAFLDSFPCALNPPSYTIF